MTGELNQLSAEILEINRANGWDVTIPEDWPNNPNKLGTKLMLVTTELAEAMEAIRHHDRANLEEELADSLIRILDMAAGLGIDMDTVVNRKLAINSQRGYRHGGKAV